VSGYRGSPPALRMAVLARMTGRGPTREERAGLAGMTPITVLEVCLHTPTELDDMYAPGQPDHARVINP